MQIDIISGFFGAGKTTFLNRYLPCLTGQVVLIENEFGEIGLDAQLVNKDIIIKEINSGCICCTLQTDFATAIKEIYAKFSPDRILIEPTGIGKLSHISNVCDKIKGSGNIDIRIDHKIVIIDASSFCENLEDFGSFYLDQIANGQLIFLNRWQDLTEDQVNDLNKKIMEINQHALISWADIQQISNKELMNIINKAKEIETEFKIAEELYFEDNELESITICSNKNFEESDLMLIREALEKHKLGDIVRAKGIINSSVKSKQWHFDYTLNSFNFKLLAKTVCEPRLIFIGKKLNNIEIEKLK